jgi:hypothetical protein
MKTFNLSGAQGEVNPRRVEKLPNGLTAMKPENGKFIVGHSESGNVHYLPEGPGVTVMERTENVPQGMRIFYAILSKARGDTAGLFRSRTP